MKWIVLRLIYWKSLNYSFLLETLLIIIPFFLEEFEKKNNPAINSATRISNFFRRNLRHKKSMINVLQPQSSYIYCKNKKFWSLTFYLKIVERFYEEKECGKKQRGHVIFYLEK